MKQISTRLLVTSSLAFFLGSFSMYAKDPTHKEEHHEEPAHGTPQADHADAGSQGHESHHGPIQFEVGFVNQRLWRGFVENDTSALQPKIGFHYKGFGVSSWSNIAHTGAHAQNWTEHEIEVEYERHFGKFKGIIGYIHYTFPDIAPTAKSPGKATEAHPLLPPREVFAASAEGASGGHKPVYPRTTQEVFVGVEHDSWLHPSFRVYRDFDARTGTYYYWSAGHPFAVKRRVVVRPTVGLGVNQDLIIHNTVVSNFEFGVAADIPMGGVIFSPFYMRSIGHRTLFGSHNLFGVVMAIQ